MDGKIFLEISLVEHVVLDGEIGNQRKSKCDGQSDKEYHCYS